MTDLNLRPVASTSKSTSKPLLTPSVLSPWKFKYAPSPNGADINLLILFHGLGDTMDPFFRLGGQLNLPNTAVLSLQAPDPIPLLETPSWSWYNTFTPLFEPLPNPNPSTVIQKLRSLLSTLCSPDIGWSLPDIHLFGFGQGGTTVLELALSIGQSPLTISGHNGRSLGSAISVCGGLISYPSQMLELETPICLFVRLDPSSLAAQKSVNPVKRAFKKVEIVSALGGGEAMPRGQDEWRGIMKFWGEVLGKDDRWKGDGDVFEVVR